MLKRPGLISGRLAQLVERFVYTEDVGGSSPSSPTIINHQKTTTAAGAAGSSLSVVSDPVYAGSPSSRLLWTDAKSSTAATNWSACSSVTRSDRLIMPRRAR